MTDKHLVDQQLDAAIDRAVRDMTRAEPRSDFRHRVIEAIARPPRTTFAWPQLTLAAAALAAVVIAFNVAKPAVGPTPDATIASVPAPTPTTPLAPTTTAPPPTAPVQSAEAPHAVAPSRASRRDTIRSTPRIVDRPVQAASIDSIDPLALTTPPLSPVVRLGLSGIDLPDISVVPLSMEPISIAPLKPRR